MIQFQGLPYLDVKIKWPNDLYLDGLKVGGILCTSTYRSKKFNVSAGKRSFFPFVLNATVIFRQRYLHVLWLSLRRFPCDALTS